MGSLVETIKDDAARRAVIDDCERLVEAEVSSKKGLSGMGIKAAFKTVKGVKPGMIPMAFHHLLDDFAAKIDPFWQECQSSNANPETFFVQRKSDVANSLLSITDDRARKSDHRVLVKAYKTLRPKAIEHISAAMPRLSQLIAKHAS